ncbi:MAG: hypothetical protein IH991_07130 [Planctomycetes bacterium]|nr:hypothetical protein [Planctomycetota bacterium]
MELLPLVAIAVVVAIIVLILLVARAGRKRREAIKTVADELGLPFFPTGDKSLIDHLSRFHLFSQGQSRKIINMIHGDTEAMDVAIFDYRYTVSSGQHSSTHSQTVVCFQSDELNLPEFSMRPEGFFHKIGGMFGYKDIDFESHATFSKAYLLRGPDEAAIRELFREEMLSHFETQKRVCVEGAGNTLVFYRAGRRVKPDEIHSLMEEGFQVLALFRVGKA